ncbi:MAG: TonB-dependent receptor [Pirellulales bacterium]|nr:TonB-dependent receptor [Pirellulales bacterium]
MVVQRIACALGMAFLTAVLLGGVFQATMFAQSPGDLYRSGPDPIAPELPQRDHGTNAQEEGATKEEKDQDDLDMLDMNLKQLSQVAVKSVSPSMGMEVSTVSRTDSTVARSPTAVYVITNEMIRRSGARNIPEILRLAPGVQVAQVTKTSWAISIRGFNARYANKLLVQIDGRAIYTPSFSGVFWDQEQVLLEDIERIEVIRGPGATVWGANAVNGVVNIVTKEAAGTRGLYAESGGGNEHRSFNSARVGGRQGDLNWRVYGMQVDDGPGYTTLPEGAWDAMQFGQGGFRMDWTPNRCDTLTLQGDFYGGNQTLRQQTITSYVLEPESIRSTNFLGRWTRKLSDDTDWSAQIYYDNMYRWAAPLASRRLNQNTFDFDYQYHTKLGSRHDVICGFGYRNYDMLVDIQGSSFSLIPPRDSFDIISYFVQDTIELHPDFLFLTAGIKLEHNDFTNFEYQPSIRLLWTPDERTSIWGAISRAVRTPSMADRDFFLAGGFVQGNRSVRSEDLLAYEMGIRRQPTDRLYWDLAVFFNRYDNLIGLYPAWPPPQIVANNGVGDSYGYELVVTYEVNPDWRLRGSYSFLIEDITYGLNGLPYGVLPGSSPRNQWFLHSAWDLSHRTTLDMIWRYVDNLAVGVPHYLTMDVRLAWEPRDGLEFALVGQNLLDNHHLEFADSFTTVTEVPSGVYGMVSWRR